MTDEKICPIMSKPFVAIAANQLPYSVDINFKNDLCYTVCLEEKCMAWRPALPEDKMKGESWDALVEYISLERGYPHDLAETFCRDNAKGRCKLIERQP